MLFGKDSVFVPESNGSRLDLDQNPGHKNINKMIPSKDPNVVKKCIIQVEIFKGNMHWFINSYENAKE